MPGRGAIHGLPRFCFNSGKICAFRRKGGALSFLGFFPRYSGFPVERKMRNSGKIG